MPITIPTHVWRRHVEALLWIWNDAKVKTFSPAWFIQMRNVWNFPSASVETSPLLHFKARRLQIKIFIIFPFYHLRSNVICMHSWIPFTFTCIVNRATTAHNDILERFGKRNASGERRNRRQERECFSFSIWAKGEMEWNEKYHYTFILWHHEFSFSDCFLLLCYYCLLESCTYMYVDDVQGL